MGKKKSRASRDGGQPPPPDRAYAARASRHNVIVVSLASESRDDARCLCLAQANPSSGKRARAWAETAPADGACAWVSERAGSCEPRQARSRPPHERWQVPTSTKPRLKSWPKERRSSEPDSNHRRARRKRPHPCTCASRGPRSQPNPAPVPRKTVLRSRPGGNLVEDSSGRKVRLLRELPAAEVVDVHQLDLGEAVGIFRGDGRIARPEVVAGHDLLAFG